MQFMTPPNPAGESSKQLLTRLRKRLFEWVLGGSVVRPRGGDLRIVGPLHRLARREG